MDFAGPSANSCKFISKLHDDALGGLLSNTGNRSQAGEIAFTDCANKSFHGSTGKYCYRQTGADSGNTDEPLKYGSLLFRRKTVERHDVFADMCMDIERHFHSLAGHHRERAQWNEDLVAYTVRLHDKTRGGLFDKLPAKMSDQASSTRSMTPMTEASIGEFGRPTEVIAENPS